MIHDIKDVFKICDGIMYDGHDGELVFFIKNVSTFNMTDSFWNHYLDQTKYLIASDQLKLTRKIVVLK